MGRKVFRIKHSPFQSEFGGRMLCVWGDKKVMAHLMFGLIALTVDQPMKKIAQGTPLPFRKYHI